MLYSTVETKYKQWIGPQLHTSTFWLVGTAGFQETKFRAKESDHVTAKGCSNHILPVLI